MTHDELRAWRNHAALTQREAADKLGVPMRTYKGWEGGDPIRHARVLEWACSAISRGCEVDDFGGYALGPERRIGRPRKAATTA